MSWVIPAGTVVAIFIAVYTSFLFHLPLRTQTLSIISGAVFIGEHWVSNGQLISTRTKNS